MKTIDLTEGPPLGRMLRFCVPVVAGNVFQMLYGAADAAAVGRLAGLDRLAAVGATGALSFLVLGFLFGLTGGFSVVVSQRRGARDEAGVRRAAAHGAMLSAALVAPVTALAVPLTRPLLRLMGTPEDILGHATTYLAIIFAGTAFTALYNLVSGVLRAVGDSRTPLWFLVGSSLLNVALDVLFIGPLRMDVAGAALATVAATAASGVLCVAYAFRRHPELRLRRADFRPDARLAVRMLRLGLPMALQTSVTAVGMVAVQTAINGFGSACVAGWTAASKVECLVIMPSFAIATTMSTFAGQNAGAGKWRRVREGVRCGLGIVLAWTAVATTFLVLLGTASMRMFVAGEPDAVASTLAAGRTYLLFVAAFFLPGNALFVLRGALEGIGRTVYTLAGGLAELAARLLVVAFLPSLLGWAGVCAAPAAAWTAASTLLALAWLRERRRFPDA